MPNPAIHIGTHDPAEPRPQAANGILAYVAGPDVVRGSRLLPIASQAESHTPQRKVTLDAENVGLVRLTYELNTYKHRRNQFWHWHAVHAEKVL